MDRIYNYIARAISLFYKIRTRCPSFRLVLLVKIFFRFFIKLHLAVLVTEVIGLATVFRLELGGLFIYIHSTN
jgi:hypothetical protein